MNTLYKSGGFIANYRYDVSCQNGSHAEMAAILNFWVANVVFQMSNIQRLFVSILVFASISERFPWNISLCAALTAYAVYTCLKQSY